LTRSYTGASTGAASAAISFPGVGVVVYGTVVNGTENQRMDVSVKLDDNDIVIPLYTPNANIAKGFDYNNQIFRNDSLPYQVHTLTVSLYYLVSFPRRRDSDFVAQITITGTTSFLVRLLAPYIASHPFD
jgi:hypothetical protein